MDKKKFWVGFKKGLKLFTVWFGLMLALTAINSAIGMLPTMILMCLGTCVAFGLVDADMP
jgi:hypothetical protein